MSDETKNVMAFGAELALLAIKYKVSPRMGMATFGHLAGLMIAHEVKKSALTVEQGKDTMLAIFTEALDRGLADGLAAPEKGRPH